MNAQHGQVAMISGASRGIGLAIAKKLHVSGYSLSLGVRDPSGMPELGAGEKPLVVHYDAFNQGDAAEWVEATVKSLGRVDVLINNAGISEFVSLRREDDDLTAEQADDALERLFHVNVFAPYRLVRAAMPHLCASGTGRVITLASMSGKRVLGLNAGYQMSKHAVLALSNAILRSGWDDGLRATAICPGFVATDMTADWPGVEQTSITQPQEIAQLVVDILRLSNSASVAELLINWRYEPGF
jgi:NAD(P)-dependent dehydrogenase (short-subunit alcohol dehydrogenase family)